MVSEADNEERGTRNTVSKSLPFAQTSERGGLGGLHSHCDMRAAELGHSRAPLRERRLCVLEDESERRLHASMLTVMCC